MSLYNEIFGMNPYAPELMSILGLNVEPAKQFGKLEDLDTPNDLIAFTEECKAKNIWPIGRFRDAYVSESDTPGEYCIFVFTRNGGGNRQDYDSIFKILEHHPNYLSNYDDSFDTTYCYFRFSVPDEFVLRCKEIYKLQPKMIEVGQRFKDLTQKDWANNQEDPEVKKTVDVGFKIINAIQDSMNNTHSSNIIKI